MNTNQTDVSATQANLAIGALKKAIRGQRGQAILRELIQALDALPERYLVFGSLMTKKGEYCALGALGRMRGMDLTLIDPEDLETVAKVFDADKAMVAELMYLNDKGGLDTTNSNPRFCRWQRIRDWVTANLNNFDETASPCEEQCREFHCCPKESSPMTVTEFFEEAKRLNLRMLGTPEEIRFVLDKKDAEIARLQMSITQSRQRDFVIRERKEFERYMTQFSECDLRMSDNDYNEYGNTHVEYSWKSWLARAAFERP